MSGPVVGIAGAIEQAVAAAMNKLGWSAGCRPIRWAWQSYVSEPRWRLSGQVSAGDYDDATSIEVAGEWAAALRLGDGVDAYGTRTWCGQVDGWPVEVWCVVDRDAFEAGGSR